MIVSFTARSKTILDKCVRSHPAPFVVSSRRVIPATIQSYFKKAKRELVLDQCGYTAEDISKIHDYTALLTSDGRQVRFTTTVEFTTSESAIPSDQVDITDPSIPQLISILELLQNEKVRVSFRILNANEHLINYVKTDGHLYPNVSITLDNFHLILF